MGLDNIPHEYPCVTKKTAVMVTGQIDCKATQEAGGCPWQNAEDRPQDGQVTGLFGTDCWYRGKYGNALIEKYGEYDETEGYSFYGSDEDGAYKSAAECFRLSSYIGGLIKQTDWDMDSEEDKKHYAGLEYAAWWLRWVATEADGTDCWY